MITTEIELTPFNVPNFVFAKGKPVRRQDGFHPAPGIPLRDLSPETLDKLCREFRDSVFAKAIEGIVE